MPELIWDEAEFTACLEVEPTIDEYETSYHYCVIKDGLRLELSIFPLAGDVCITITRDGVEQPVIDFQMTECSGTKCVAGPQGEFLEFAPSQVFGNRFQRDFVIPVGVRLSVKPSIRVQLFAK